MLARLYIPGVNFAELSLERDRATGRLLFMPAHLAELCRINGLDAVTTLADEELSCWLICIWYIAHREAGGESNPVVEQIIAAAAAKQVSDIIARRVTGEMVIE